MKKKTLTKRIVSFITALSLSISSTIMVLPASAWTETNGGQQPDSATYGGYCMQENCEGTYGWEENSDGKHILTCTVCDNTQGESHAPGEGDSTCTICDAMPTIIIEDVTGGTISVFCGDEEFKNGDKFESGKNFTISATADKGYTVTSIKCKQGSQDWSTVDGSSVTVEYVQQNLTISAEFTPNEYVVSIPTSGDMPGGDIYTTSGTDFNSKAKYGTTVTFTVTPKSGYKLVDGSVTYSYCEEGNVGSEYHQALYNESGGYYSFVMPAAPVGLHAEFTLLTYTITGDNFTYTVDGEEKTSLNYGDEVKIIPQIDDDQFLDSVKWTQDSTTYTDITADENGDYYLTIGDDFDSSKAISIQVNTTQGYQLNFANAKYTNDYSTSNAISVSATVDGKEVFNGDYIKPGKTVTLAYEESTGFTFDGWESDEVTFTDNTFEMPSKNVTVSANYSVKQYNVKLDENLPSGVTVTPVSNDVTVTAFPLSCIYNGDVSFTVNVTDDTKQIGKVYYTVDGSTNLIDITSDASGQYTISEITSDVTIYVILENTVTHNVTVNITGETEHGSVTPYDGSSFENVKVGDTVRFVVTSDQGYNCSISLSGQNTFGDEKDDNGSVKYFHFTMPDNDVTINVSFFKAYSVTADEADGGTVKFIHELGFELNNGEMIDVGARIIILPTADVNYIVSSVKYSYGGNDYEVTADADGKYSFTMPAANVTVNVTFTRTFKFEYSIASGEGKIEPYGDQKFDGLVEGDVVKFTITPEDGYVINKIGISENDGTEPTYYPLTVNEHKNSAGEIDYYYVTVRKANPYITVNFAKTYNVTVADTENGTADIKVYPEGSNYSHDGSKPIFEEDTIVIEPIPNDKYEVDKVTVSYNDDTKTITADKNGDYSFEMPAYDVTVEVTFKKLPDTFEVAIGTEKGTADTWAEVMKFITEKGKDKDVTVTLNSDYSFTSTDKLPTEVKSLKITGEGTLKFVGVTSLNIPVDTTLDVITKVANSKNNLIDITVAAGKNLNITEKVYNITDEYDISISDIQFINTIKGGNSSTLEGAIIANTIQNFAAIASEASGAAVYVSNSLSKVDKIINSEIVVVGSTTKVEIGKAVGDTEIDMLAGGAIPKVTINDYETIGKDDVITVYVFDSYDFDSISLVNVESGTTILNSSNASKVAKYVTIASNKTDYTAVGNDKTKEIKAMIPSALTVTVDGTTTPCATLDDAVKLMTENKDYILTLNADLTVPSNFSFPKGLKSLTINSAKDKDYEIIFTGTKLAIPYDITFNVGIVASNKTDLIDITVAKDATLTINEDSYYEDSKTGLPVAYINKITGTNTSTLKIGEDRDVAVNNISTFKTVEAEIDILGSVTGVTNFDGVMIVLGEKSTVTIANVVDGSEIYLCKNSSGVIPKLTITDVIKKDGETYTEGQKPEFTVQVEELDSECLLTTGTTVLYTKGKDLSENVKIGNITESDCELTAVYYTKTKSIKAECKSAINVLMDGKKIDGVFKNLDDVNEVINKQTGKHDYIIELTTDITADSKYAFPANTKTNIINSITIKNYVPEDGGSSTDKHTITFTGTKLAIPYDVTFEVFVAASNKTNLIDITVGKNATLALAAGSDNIDYSTYETKGYINKLSGDKNTSKLEISGDVVYVNSVSNFKEITAVDILGVAGAVSNVGSFDGKLSVFGDKASITIENIYDGSTIAMSKTSKGTIPKLTLTDVISKPSKSESENESTPQITIRVLNGIYGGSAITNGTVVAYTKGKDLSANIRFSDDSLTASYNSSKKTITAVNNSALKLEKLKLVEGEYVVDDSVNAISKSSFDEIFAEINKVKYNKGDTIPAYQITVNSDIELPTNFALPKSAQASAMVITGSGTLTFTGTKLAVPYDLTLDVKIMADNKSGKLDIAVAKDCDLTIKKAYFDGDGETCFGKVTGSGTSALISEHKSYSDTFTSVSGFDYVEGSIVVEGAFTKINRFAGGLELYGEKASADIGTIDGLYNDKTSSGIILYTNSKGELPKVTIGSIVDNVELTVRTDSEIGSGKTILYTKTNTFDDVDRITIDNNGSESLSPSFNSKAKTITAVAEYTVVLSTFSKDLDLYNSEESDFTAVDNKNEGKFATIDEAVAYINEKGNSSTGYFITLTDNIDCPKLTLPKSGKAAKLVIYGNGNSIDVGKTSSITVNNDVILSDIYFVTSAKTLTLNANGNVDVWGDEDDGANIDTFKGSPKYTFTLSGKNYRYYDVTGFGTVHVKESSQLVIYTTFKTNNLVLDKNAQVYFGHFLKTATFSSLDAAKGAGFCYSHVPSNTVKFTGKAENFKVDKSGFIFDGNVFPGSKVLSTKALTDLSIFKYKYDLGYVLSFKQVGNDICASGKVYELESDKSSSVRSFSDWDDVVKAINTANNSKATYTVYIDDYVGISKFTLPAKGKYKELIIEGNGGKSAKQLVVSGNITLTGNTTFKNIIMYSLSGKFESSYANYTVNASGYDLVLDNAYLHNASIKAKNLTIYNGGSELLFNKVDVTDTITISGENPMYIKSGITTKNLVLEQKSVFLALLNGAKLNVTDTLSYKGDYMSGVIVEVLDDFENYGKEPTSTFAKNYSLGKVKNGSNLVLLYPYAHQGYMISPDSSGNLYVTKGTLSI